MSWSGFKKDVNRATTQVMMKTGHVEKTSDRDYEIEERRYRTLESASMRLQKEAKGYLDSLRAMTASQMRIAETIDAFYGDSGARDGVSRSYKQAVEDLDAETVKALDGPYRCVPLDIQESVKGPGIVLDDVQVKEVEAEWNWKAGNRRVYTKETRRDPDEKGFRKKIKLIDYVYRTTVLEPINRFCAYFPDVNECIKKRNHKMLDYDAMRSKVKKLTEKPDKDPGKLPRTEKETEMVSDIDFLSDLIPQPKRPRVFTLQEILKEDRMDSTLPSPSKVIHRPNVTAHRYGSLGRRLSTIGGENRCSNDVKQAHPSQHSFNVSNGSRDDVSQHSVSSASSSSTVVELRGPVTPTLSPRREAPKFPSKRPQLRTVSVPDPSIDPFLMTITSTPVKSDISHSRFISQPLNRGPQTATVVRRTSERGSFDLPLSGPSNHSQTPFFNPSDLEDIMAPLRADFIRREADALAQAKQAYEQLNEQLTNELPQLIDLRVPYLDPSFEALVKIQLRFCAEAYSRMAQVQQYLDASTRDQYASGDLDARVEEVLGNIRELSIASTV